ADQAGLLSNLALSPQGYQADYETLGLKGSFNAIPPSFASAAVSPLAFYKFYAGEGGMRVPLIITGEPLGWKGVTTHALTYVSDLAPTILDLTGTPAPGLYTGGRAVEPMQGHSLLPLGSNPDGTVHPENEPIGYELAGNAALFRGDYKIVFNRGPAGDGLWHLYNIAKDPGESHDLAAREPARLQDMLGHYERYARENQVLTVPLDYNPQIQVVLNGLHARGAKAMLIGVLLVTLLLPFVFFRRVRKTYDPAEKPEAP
ncbi:MAG: arylsulfatase, partial [Myxococcota bacterium]|nr:arylsulfatase [Myxococcota bacterium]